MSIKKELMARIAARRAQLEQSLLDMQKMISEEGFACCMDKENLVGHLHTSLKGITDGYMDALEHCPGSFFDTQSLGEKRQAILAIQNILAYALEIGIKNIPPAKLKEQILSMTSDGIRITLEEFDKVHATAEAQATEAFDLLMGGRRDSADLPN